MINGAHIPQEDIALYAMQSLSLEDAAVVRAHLESCLECRTELAEVAGDLALISLSVEPQALPEGARGRFLDRVAASVPAIAPAPPAEPARTATVTSLSAAPSRRASSWIPWALAAALALAAVGLGLQVQRLNRQVAEQTAQAAAEADRGARAQQVLDLLTARTAQHILLTAAGAHPQPTARAVYLASRGSLILQAANLNPLPAGKTYELWIIPAGGSAPVAAGLFQPDSQGSASLVLPQLPAGVAAKAFGITVENEGGAASPTMPIVLSGAAPAVGE